MSQPDSSMISVDGLIDRFLPDGAVDSYLNILLKENSRLNLVSRETTREHLRTLVAESLAPLSLLDSHVQHYLDIGSGGGLPAIPIILSEQMSGKSVLVERSRKKTAALRRMMYQLNIKPVIEPVSFEQFTTDLRFDLITIRLVRATFPLLQEAVSLLTEQGVLACFSRPAVMPPATKYMHYQLSACESNVDKWLTLIRKS